MKKNIGSVSDYRRQDGFTPTPTLGENKSKLVSGFTLIELLVVIAIIGILATITMVVLSGVKNRGIDAKVKAQLKSMDSQALLFSESAPSFITITPETAGNISPVAGINNLFLSDTNPNSLYNLLNKLPNGTTLYFGWNGVKPDIGGKWFVAAGTKTGAMGIDFTGSLKSWKGDTPSDPADFTAIFPDANAPLYSCQRVNDNPVTPPPDPECSDGKDNDKDGFADKDDLSCYKNSVYLPNFDDESYSGGVNPECSDGNDNDGDGFKDNDDPECHIGGNINEEFTPDWDSEKNPSPK